MSQPAAPEAVSEAVVPASASGMRLAVWIAGGAGLALAIALLLRGGIPEILRLLDIAGWRLLWLVPVHLVPLACFGCAWRMLLIDRETTRDADDVGRHKYRVDRSRVPGLGYLTWAAVVREAVGVLLPVARVGGEVAGARLLVRRGIGGVDAGASVVVELMLTVAAQLVFAIGGFVLLLGYPAVGPVVRDVALGLLASAAGVAAFFLVQRRWGLFRLMERALSAIAGPAMVRRLGDPARLDAAIRASFRRRGGIVGCAAWQLVGMVAGALELWVTLRLLGQPAGARAAIVVESLSVAVQSIMFMVPAGLGAQEGGFLVFGAAVGLSPQVALALSLARRVRQIVLGIPALGSWYWIERNN